MGSRALAYAIYRLWVIFDESAIRKCCHVRSWSPADDRATKPKDLRIH